MTTQKGQKKQNGTEQAQTDAHPLTQLLELLDKVSNRLEAIAGQSAPDWQLPLFAYRTPWPDRIHATVIARDDDGPTKVVWCGHTYTRRTGAQKYGAAIWFSRGIRGSDKDFARLITFSDGTPAEPLPQYIKNVLPPPRTDQ
jgi:hypothetical protein